MANKTLYVGNLPYSANESSLLAMFSDYEASNARIIEGRGFGFVDVSDARFDAAVADKNNSVVEGRTLTVNEARPRENSGGGGGGYGGSKRPSGGKSRW